MVLNYMDYQIKQLGRSNRATVYQNGKEILSLEVEGRMSPEKLVESAGLAMQKAGLAYAGTLGRFSN